ILQDGGRQWRTDFAAGQAARWDPLNQRLAGTSVDLAPVQQNLTRMVDNLNLPEVQRVLSPQLAARLRDALTIDAPGGTVSWYQAQGLRSLIGDAMGVPEISAGLGDANMKSIYGSVSDAMRRTAAAHGQDGLFDAANNYSTQGYAFRDGTLQKII